MNNRTLRDNNPIQSLLRFATLIVVMLTWMVPAKAQESGVYYIASDGNSTQSGDYTYNAGNSGNNYYLRPAANPQQTNYIDAYWYPIGQPAQYDSDKPFLTTNKTGHDVKTAAWVLVKTSDEGNYYYFIHIGTNKYVKCEPCITGTLGENNDSRRKTMHLEACAAPPDVDSFKFQIAALNENDKYIIPKIIANKTYKYWNIASKNQPYNNGQGNSPYFGGLLGLFDNASDPNSKWILEKVLLDAPNISDLGPGNNVTVTDNNNLPEGYNIHYTTDETIPDASSPIMSGGTYHVVDACILKAVVERYGVVLTDVATKNLVPTLDPPVFTYNCETQKVSMSCLNNASAEVYYTKTTDGTEPEDPTNSSTHYENPIDLMPGDRIKAVSFYLDAYSDISALNYSGTYGVVPTITSDDCSSDSPRGNVMTIDGLTGPTYWYIITAENGDATPDEAPNPANVPYTEYTLGTVLSLDTLTEGKNGYCTVHFYDTMCGSFLPVRSIVHQLKTSGKPILTPPVGSSPVVTISGGVYGDVAICSATGVATQNIPLASDGTAEYTISPEATGTLTVTFKHGDWLNSCEATYTLPGAPATPTWSQECDNLLQLHCATPMAVIHFTTDGEEPTLESYSYVAGCLDTLSEGRRIRAKAFLGFRASGELDYPYYHVNPDEPQFFVDGSEVTISIPEGTRVYYTKSVGNAPHVVPDDPDDPTSDSPLYSEHIDIAGDNIITVFKAIAISTDNPEHKSCVVRVVTREGYSINTANDLTKLVSHSGSYFFVFNDIDASTADGEHVFYTVSKFTGVLDGNFHTISKLGKPLFDTISGNSENNAAVLNLMLKEVTVNNATGNAGAIANDATGYTRIYNCGILPDDPDGTTTSSISGVTYVGGLVGKLDGTSRVINCFSYANITGGTNRAGIVGYNNIASTSGNLQTMVMNCMFYGNITSGYTAMSPIYGGELIHNLRASNEDTGLNNYCYFLYKDQDYLNAVNSYDIAKGSLGAEERFLNRFEFFRMTLNSTRALAAYYVYNSVLEKDLMAKWVLDKSIAPYPILKEPGYYPSIVNYDAEHAAPIDPDNVYYNQGRKLGTLRVNIRMGNGAQFNHPGTGDNEAQIITSQLNLNVIDKDPNNFNFNYKKVQLPYYNQVGSKNYTGNCVVTGWKIVEINGSETGTGTFVNTGTDAPAFNFVDRACSNKDLYSVSGRVFSQGAYWEVPDGVTSITIEPYWAKAVYLSDANYDVTYNGITKYGVTVVGNCPNIFDGQTVYNTVTGTGSAMANLNPDPAHTVYDYAVVLVGNYHQYTTAAIVNDAKPVTFMSADLDGDLEPDNTLFYYHDSRKQISPVRFDFINIPGVGTVKRTWNSGTNPQPGIFRPRAWFEVTNTALIRCGQFEYASSNDKTTMAPLILQGGIYEQFVSCQAYDAANTNYILVGGNAWFRNLANGCHTEKYLKTPKVPINVAGGEYGNLYLSGIYQENGTPEPEAAECYIDGGSFTNVAGAGMQKIDGNVNWFINAADIVNFYGGGINAAQNITGNITTKISNSRVGEFYGGPKFGDMEFDKKVTTTASDCHFDLFFGAGYGGTAFKRKDCVNDSEVNDHPGWGSHVSKHYKRKYSPGDGGISTDYEYEFILHSDGNKTVARFFVNYASLSLASTRNVETDLTGCTMRKFYGGGRLGSVNGDVTSTLTDCTIEEDVFGSGYSADAPTVKVFPVENMNPDPQYNRPAGVFNDAQVKFPTGVTFTWKQVPNVSAGSEFDETNHYIYTTVDLSNLGTVQGNATLTLQGNTKVYGNVYGGGAKSNSNTNGGVAKTTVNILGGTYGIADSTSYGNIYGGGMGDANNAVTEGIVEVNIGNSTQSANNVVIYGSVYGCNNANGSPKDNVTVNIYKTKHNSDNMVSGSEYAIYQVFGGGNQAHYTPTSADKKTTVHIHDCDNTIEYVYGGGNAANVGVEDGITSGTEVIIDGGHMDWIFGGGNGAGNTNLGANIFGDAAVTFHAGKIGHLFGGSNEKGSISGTKTVSVLGDGLCDPKEISELYGGNNKADATGDISLTMACTDNPCKIDYLFGGSRQANITGNVELNVYGGEYDYVFGGNNISGAIGGNVTLNLYGGTIHEAAFGGNKGGGSIGGNITVNVNDAEDLECPLEVNNVFGAGDQAVYTAPTGEGARDFNPMVNINHIRSGETITGNVYGGGNGHPDSISQVPGSVTGNPKVIIGDLIEGHRAAISGNVYGGGNAAKVDGTTMVLMQKANSIVSHDIYGGGNLAHVTGSSIINVNDGTVTQDVYGGGALANVGTSNSDSTVVTISGGTIRDVYGGGLGQTTPTSIAALVNGKVKVKALGGTISNMFGCNNVNGAPQSTVHVIVNDTTTAHNLTIGNVYGGGNLAAYSGTPDVDINIGTVTGRVFGGGNEAGVSGGDVTMIGGTVNGGLYGGCNTSGTIANAVTVRVTGGTIGTANAVNGAVYGGGLGENTKVKGDVTVTIDGGTFNNDVYGGSAKGLVNCDDAGTGATEDSNTDVILNAGTINGSLYGGGHGINNANAHVWGPVQVTVNGGTVTGSVYGCNNASGAPQSTVKVDIYDTDHPGFGYALGHVFGGGNQADYTAGVPTVKVHGCDNSINYVYGGGNAAAVNGTDVTIYGGNSIAHVFGGCYGADVTTGGTDVKIYGGTIDTIYGGNNESGSITGDIRVTVDKQPEHADDSCAMHIKEVYGGGNKAASNAGQITIAYTGYDPAERINYVYGGANRANVTGPINLTIREGRIDNVFGGNNNSGSISNGITVNIEKDKTTPARVWEIGNVFGGGNLAVFSGTPSVNVKNGTVANVFGGGNGDPDDATHEKGKVGATNVTVGDDTPGYKAVVTGNVYGGGNAANVTGATSISLTPNSTVNTGVYGGCNTQGNVGGDITVTVNCDSIGSRAKLNTLVTSDVFGGGYGQETSTSGDVVVNINGGIIYGDVYGGSALGEVNTEGGTNTTTVNINGGTLETKTTTGTTPGGQSYFIYHGGNVYGGGLGRKADDPNPAISAEVHGKVFVNIGSVIEWDPEKPGYTLTTAGDATIKGNIYGCNNTYGSPQDDVVVNVYQTAHTPGVDGVDDDGYALANVFGGGNEADFTATDKTTTVNIYSCDNTIQRTFGGSNAAASNSVTTMIQGGRINEAFGGGNGEVRAANVNGIVVLAIHGGSIGQSFSGSNQNGVITGTSTVTIDNAGCGGVVVDEHFCGGNFADWVGDIEATIECADGMHVRRLYGGCKQANVVSDGGSHPGNVHLTVKGGTYEYIYGGSQGYIDPNNPENNISADIQGNVQLDVYGGTVTKAIFGGSHVLGKIHGTVIVNVEDKYNDDYCPLDMSEADVYGGGNQADYPGEGVTHEGEYNYPQVNIKNATVKNVFGGGLEAEVKGNPQIKIKKGSKILGNVYGGGNMGEVIGDPKVIVNGKDDTPNPIE